MFFSLSTYSSQSIGYGWRIVFRTTAPRLLFLARRSIFCWATLWTPLFLVGCNSADSDFLPADILLTSEPDGVQTVLEVRETLLGLAGPIEVIVVGKIGGLNNPWQQTEPDFPFVKGAAKFFLADPGAVAEQQADGHQHAPDEECAFCAAHAQDSSALLALVQFKDKQGEILRRDARQWLTLKGNETVVVHGQARIVPGGLLVIDADSLYVRR